MSNLCFFVSSAINLDNTNNIGFSYSPKRSAFNAEERFRQTQYTLNSIRLIEPEAEIYLVDISENASEYAKRLSYVPNLQFISVQDLAPDIAEQCRTNNAKGYCETLSTKFFFDNYIDNISSRDFLCKISGRYFYTAFQRHHFIEENLDKYIFKPLHLFNWQDNWQFPEELKFNNKCKWIFTCTFAIGKKKFHDFRNKLNYAVDFYQKDASRFHVDYECVLPYCVLDDPSIFGSFWHVSGWGGANGDFGIW